MFKSIKNNVPKEYTTLLHEKISDTNTSSHVSMQNFPLVVIDIYGNFNKKRYVKALCLQMQELYAYAHKNNKSFFLIINMKNLTFINPTFVVLFTQFIKNLTLLTDRYLISSSIIIENNAMKNLMNKISQSISSSRPNIVTSSLTESLLFIILSFFYVSYTP